MLAGSANQNIVRLIEAIFLCRMEDKPILCTPTELRLVQQVLRQMSQKRSKEVNSEILKILLDHPEFTRLHLSLYYPFTLDDLEKYRDKLIWGSIRYTTFVWDIKQVPIEFAEIGLSFNVNLFMLCTEEEFVIARQIGIEQDLNATVTRRLPLHLAGELEDRYATTVMAPYIQKSILGHFDVGQKAEDILIAHDLYYSQDLITDSQTLKSLIVKYGLLAAYSKVLWDEFLIRYMNEEMMKTIMKSL
jgi:hypothetical protein